MAKKDEEKILCDDCAHNVIRNLAWGLNTYVCKSCEKKWKISGAIPITHGEHAKRDLADRLLELLRAADRSESSDYE
jgi:ribosomal protein L37AE/L43A